jgi:hypothetical protein
MFDLLPISLVHGLVDQASFALLYYKLHKLSITLPLHSKTFWYYAPSCLLSDILVIAGLQIAVSYLTHSPAGGAIPEKGAKHNQDELEALLQDVDDHISVLEYEKHDEPEPTISLPPSRSARCLRACCKVVLAAVSLLTSFVSYTSVVAYKSEREFAVVFLQVVRLTHRLFPTGQTLYSPGSKLTTTWDPLVSSDLSLMNSGLFFYSSLQLSSSAG